MTGRRNLWACVVSVVAVAGLPACGGSSAGPDEPSSAHNAPITVEVDQRALVARQPSTMIGGLSGVFGDVDGSPWTQPLLLDAVADADVEAAEEMHRVGQLLAAHGNRPPAASAAPAGFRAGRLTGQHPAELGVDEPDVERSTKRSDVDIPGAGELHQVVTTEARVEQRRLHLDVEKTTDGTTANVAGSSRVMTGFEVGACPTSDGMVTGTITRDMVLVDDTAAGTGRRLTVHVTADVVATVGSDRRPTSYLLDSISVTVDRTLTGSPDLHLSMAGRVGGLDPSDEFGTGTVEMTISAPTSEAIQAGNEVLARLLDELHQHARAALGFIASVTDHGLCVKLEVDRHDVTALEAGQTAPLDVTVVDAVTGEQLDLPVQAVGVYGRVSPDRQEHSPAAFTVSTGTPRPAYKVSVWTDTVRGAHTVDVEYGGAVGWKVDTTVGPFRVQAVKCGDIAGTWVMHLTASFQGGEFTGDVTAEIATGSLTGPFTLIGRTQGGGVVVEQRGEGTLSFRQNAREGSWFELDTQTWQSWARFGGQGGGAASPGRVPVLPATASDCGS